MRFSREPTRREAVGLGLAALLAVGTASCASPNDQTGNRFPVCGDGSGSITYIGDSLTNGTENDSGMTSRFPAIISRELLFPARVLATNGSGYVQVGPATDARDFLDQSELVRPDTSLVVVLGSRNDMNNQETRDSVEDQARRTFERIHELAPNARVLVVGPPWINDEPPSTILDVRDSIERATLGADVDWVDPISEGWFAEPEHLLDDGRSEYIAPDRIHPNDEGHAYLASKLLPLITERVCPT